MLTAIFLHAGLLHLLYNGWALLQFGSLLETLYGSPVFLVIFFASGVIASAASSLFLDAEYGVGASGAIFGIVGALIAVMGPIKARRAKVARLLQWQLALWAIVTIAGGFISVTIDNTAHVAGFVAGLTMGALLRWRNQAESRSSVVSSSSSARLTGKR
jgi:rhomboid protease GluP